MKKEEIRQIKIFSNGERKLTAEKNGNKKQKEKN